MRINASALHAAAAVAAVLLSAGAARADASPIGLWIDHTGRGAVEITDCNGKLCGHVAWLKDPKNAEACGEQVLGDVKPMGNGKWDQGWIYDPDNAAKYDVELTPVGADTLSVLGYAGTKWLSETMTWKRAPADLKKCAKPGAAAAAPAAASDTAATAAAAKAEPKTEAKTETLASTEAKVAAPATAEAKDSADKTSAKPDIIAGLAEALKVTKSESTTPAKGSKGTTCKMDVPYLDVVVQFPCEH